LEPASIALCTVYFLKGLYFKAWKIKSVLCNEKENPANIVDKNPLFFQIDRGLFLPENVLNKLFKALSLSFSYYPR